MDDIVILIEKLMADHSDDLKRTAYVMLGDEQLSEDVTQETFLSFYKNHHKFRGESSYKTYLYRILLNHIKMHWRKKTPQTLDSLIENSDVLIFEDLLVNVLDLHHALRQLKDTYKEVITLHYFNEYSIEEIAAILDLSNSNVKMRLKRGRDVLKKNLIGGINS
jgi:RNA polymerase sigma-70 factor (ECF subfamily)